MLIDEYDTPIHTAAANGYYDEAMEFFRGFYGAGLKDNPNLTRAVLTGILKVGKEGIFSGLNHVQVDTVLDDRASSAFGFTESEVDWLREQTGTAHSMDQFRTWYNGYRVGEHTLYNPWSVLACMVQDEGRPRRHWVATGGVTEAARLIWRGDDALIRDIERWLRREAVDRSVTDSVTFALGGIAGEAVVATLVHGGYLTFTHREADDLGWRCTLVVPNRDVLAAFAQVAAHWLSGGTTVGPDTESFARALLDGREPEAAQFFDEFVTRTLSYHLVGGNAPEKVFHAFVAGMLVCLERTHHVWTDTEAGFGRADLLVAPKAPGGKALVMEFKRVERGKGGIRGAIAAAKQQIETREYERKLGEFEPSSVVRWALSWEGKRVTAKVV